MAVYMSIYSSQAKQSERYNRKPVPVNPAATVIPLRDAEAGGLELLLVRRNPNLVFHGGAWVFPGGRIDSVDYRQSNGGGEFEAARLAAVREAHEEAGIHLNPDRLVQLSRWTTPPGFPRRFKTWFFIAEAGTETVKIDGQEILAHQWISPAQAIQSADAGRLELPPPTHYSIQMLMDYHTVEEALEGVAQASPYIFEF
jgi:8-oxo-dGTP pyrophosphatase MutT (NUDIX family)